MSTEGIKAVHTLATMGFAVTLEGKTIRFRYRGCRRLNRERVEHLVEFIRENKQAVIEFLKVYCPKCGGVVFWIDENGDSKCLKCEPCC